MDKNIIDYSKIEFARGKSYFNSNKALRAISCYRQGMGGTVKMGPRVFPGNSGIKVTGLLRRTYLL